MIQPLSDLERDEALGALQSWRYDGERRTIHRRLTFGDFPEALAAMVRIGAVAERTDHHPEWSNVYNRVDIWLTTHDAGGVSSRDIALASVIDRWFPADRQ